MAEISVSEVEPSTFEVVVDDGSSSTTHHVTVEPEDLEGLPEASSADLVEASFRFMLDREPKESILRKFDLGVISKYFPEYRDEIGSYL